MTRFLRLFTLLIGMVMVFPTLASADENANLATLGTKVVKPLVSMELKEHFSPVQMRISTPGMQSLGRNKTRMIYYARIQLADGTLMNIPESYDVVKTRDNSGAGRFASMSVYEVHPAGEANSILTVGLSPADEVVVLKGAQEQVPALVPKR